MVILLENGNIKRSAPVRNDEFGVTGDVSIEITPSDPMYIKSIFWLSSKDKARAEQLYAEAQHALSVK